MRTRNLRQIGLTMMLGLAVVLSAPTPARGASPCPPGQPPGRPPGQPPNKPGQPPGRPPQYPPGQCQMRLSRSQVAAGESVTAAGDGFTPRSSVRLALSGQDLQSATTDSNGSFVQDVTVPASTAPSTYQVTAAGSEPSGGTRVLAATLTVTRASAARRAAPARGAAVRGATGTKGAPAGALSRTGSATAVPLTLAALGLIGVGTLAVVGVRRRRA